MSIKTKGFLCFPYFRFIQHFKKNFIATLWLLLLVVMCKWCGSTFSPSLLSYHFTFSSSGSLFSVLLFANISIILFFFKLSVLFFLGLLVKYVTKLKNHDSLRTFLSHMLALFVVIAFCLLFVPCVPVNSYDMTFFVILFFASRRRVSGPGPSVPYKQYHKHNNMFCLSVKRKSKSNLEQMDV